MATNVHENVKKYYGSCLESSSDLQTSAASCSLPRLSLSKSAVDALGLVHPEVTKRFYGCGLPVPEKLHSCKVLDLGSGSGRDCYALSKLVGPGGHITGIDMTEELILSSRKYIEYHQEKYGYDKPNTSFVLGYMEKLGEAGIEEDSMDIVISNCVLCLCPDKTAVLQEAYKVLKTPSNPSINVTREVVIRCLMVYLGESINQLLKEYDEGGELYFSDMYASKVVPDHFKQDPTLWGEGMGGSLFWRDFISLAREVGFTTPHLVSASLIIVHNCELKNKAGGVNYASSTYRLFKLAKNQTMSKATVTYKGTLPELSDQFDFDSSHCFKKDVAVEVDGEMAAILQNSRFSHDFIVQMLDEPETSCKSTPQYCSLNPFLLADQLGSSVKQCSKISQSEGCSA